MDTLRRLLGEDTPERVAFEQAIARGRGGANNPHGCKGKPEEEEAEGINPHNVRVDSLPPRDRSKEPAAGNSYAYAIRRLTRAAEGGSDRARELLDDIGGCWGRSGRFEGC